MTFLQGHLAGSLGPGLGLGLPLRGEGQQGHLKDGGLKAGLKATQGHSGEAKFACWPARVANVSDENPAKATQGHPLRPEPSCSLIALLWSFAPSRRHTQQGTLKDSIKAPPWSGTARRRALSESRVQYRVSTVVCWPESHVLSYWPYSGAYPERGAGTGALWNLCDLAAREGHGGRKARNRSYRLRIRGYDLHLQDRTIQGDA